MKLFLMTAIGGVMLSCGGLNSGMNFMPSAKDFKLGTNLSVDGTGNMDTSVGAGIDKDLGNGTNFNMGLTKTFF